MPTNNPFLPPTGNKSAAPSNPTPMPGTSSSASADNFAVDLTEVKSNFTIPDGLYKVRCTEIEQSVSKSGNPMFVWTFQVSEGEHAGHELKVFTAVTPAAMWKVAETVEALGIGQTGSVVKFKRSDVLNRECGAMVEASEYNGQSRSSVTRVMSLQKLAEARNAG